MRWLEEDDESIEGSDHKEDYECKTKGAAVVAPRAAVCIPKHFDKSWNCNIFNKES